MGFCRKHESTVTVANAPLNKPYVFSETLTCSLFLFKKALVNFQPSQTPGLFWSHKQRQTCSLTRLQNTEAENRQEVRNQVSVTQWISWRGKRLLNATVSDGSYKKLYSVQFFLKRSFNICHLSDVDDIFAQRLRARWVKQVVFSVKYHHLIMFKHSFSGSSL